MRKALIVGGANGIGLAIATELANRNEFSSVYIVDKSVPEQSVMHEKFVCTQFDLTASDFSLFDSFSNIDTLIITAGFGKLSLFKNIPEEHIVNSMAVNSTAVMRIVHHFYDRICSGQDFYCGVMVSIAGFMSSPFFAVYGASKAALKIFIESINVELEKAGVSNRILNVSPGSIKGTSFNNGKTDLSQTKSLATEILQHLYAKDDLFIPMYDEIFHKVLERYHQDFRKEGRHSYDYKIESGRIK